MSRNERAPVPAITLRPMAVGDAHVAAELAGELGYPVREEDIRARLGALSAREDHAVYVACADGKVVGWIDVGIAQHLISEPSGEITGLVVSAAYRGQGIGRELLAYAEQWIARRGVAKAVVRSRISREAAHAFYLGQKYLRVKTSVVFAKSLAPG